MQIYILDSNYDKLGYVDNAESILWNKKLNDVGECELYVPADKDYVDMIFNGKYAYREDDDMICELLIPELTTDVESGNYIVATGFDMKKILSGRIVRWSITYSGSVVNFIKKLIVDNVINPDQSKRAIKNFTFNDSNFNEFNETITVKAFTEDLLEIIKTTCKTFNYGFRVKYINATKTLEFGLFKGTNKASYDSETHVEFSPQYSNIISSKYKEDKSNYKNVCYVGYKDVNDVMQMMMVYNTDVEPTGEDRKEIYIDGSSTSREVNEDELKSIYPNVKLNGSSYYNNNVIVANINDEKIVVTDATYLLLLKILALNTLSSYTKVTEFSGEVDYINSYEYKIDYDLGDIVKVKNEYGIEAEAIITEIMESEDTEDGSVIEPRFEYIN